MKLVLELSMVYLCNLNYSLKADNKYLYTTCLVLTHVSFTYVHYCKCHDWLFGQWRLLYYFIEYLTAYVLANCLLVIYCFTNNKNNTTWFGYLLTKKSAGLTKFVRVFPVFWRLPTKKFTKSSYITPFNFTHKSWKSVLLSLRT